ncbi:hypothetical protein HK405_007585 [Cladochytrium tenue]|nr:hypothetical protein HK405_007585 [Cladochytrium tenue]
MFKKSRIVEGSEADAGSTAPSQYPYTLNAYISPPRNEITVDEFEIWALDRLRVLKAIENSAIRNRSQEETIRHFRTVADKHLPLTTNTHVRAAGEDRLYEERKKDHCSHYILRLAYCRSEENRSWFLRYETALFRLRLEAEAPIDRDSFIKSHSLDADAELVSSSDLRALLPDLRAVHPPEVIEHGRFYRVPFDKVHTLVSKRAAVLAGGFAIVPESERPVLIVSAFYDRLSQALEATSRSMPRMEEDDRLIPVLDSIARQLAARDYDNSASRGNSAQIRAAEVDRLAKEGHFPPCMLNLQTNLLSNSHLKHFGRLQYSLFLKGVGLPLEEALIYWRKSFSKLSDDAFNKAYAYNIRFNYGREGSRKDYAPYSCQRIITTNPPGPGDHHGCPFRHGSQDSVRSLCSRMGVSDAQLGEVGVLMKDGHYQIACTRVFEIARLPSIRKARAPGNTLAAPVEPAVDVIEHPNQWFDLSYRTTVSNNSGAPPVASDDSTQDGGDGTLIGR